MIDKEYVLKEKTEHSFCTYQYCTVPAGSSDIASLIYRTGNGETGEITFGEDNTYSARLIAGDTEVPEHYKQNKILDTDAPWLWLYDDDGKTLDLWNAKGFEVYRAGEMGLLIRFK